MERKVASMIDKIGPMPDYNDFLPKMPIKPKESPSLPVQMKSVMKMQSEFMPASKETEINLLSKYLKNELNLIPHTNRNLEEKKLELHLPKLSKKEIKKELETSNSNYRSPNFSPCITNTEFPLNKRQEMKSPFKQSEVQTDCEVFIQVMAKRGSSAHRPLKSRKKVRSTEKSNNQRDANLDVLLMNRNNSDLGFFMKEYSRRQGLNENSKVFILTGQHDFIRRAFKRRGWVENKNINSQAFHIKWCFNDSEYDYRNLKNGQQYNHFPSNRELTTKSGLAKNLRNITDFRINIDRFFPRCYDLGDSLQIKELVRDYHKTSIFNIIKKISLGFVVDETLAISAITYVESNLIDHLHCCEKIKNKPNFCKENTDKLVGFKDYTIGWMKTQILEKVNDQIQDLKKIYPQFDMEGCENIWIIKPGQNARGSGVHCVRNLEEILDSGSKMQSRIVQKYLERPLLLETPAGFCKFDIRMWVLVTSFDPLTIFFYNSCYCRICQEPYTLESLDSIKHLANFSIQKTIAKDVSDTVWNLGDLMSFLEKKGAKWKDILPKIHLIVIQTLRAVSENVEQKSGCFELYGFDIILDQFFQPWLLEVNLSPACAERTEWISSMLDSMGDGLLSIVLDSSIKQPLYSSDLIPQYQFQENSQEWVFLFKAETNGEEYCLTKTNLEIYGEKFNLKKEKIQEKKFLMLRSALIIQWHARKFLVKIRNQKKKICGNVIKIQVIIRRKLAYLKKMEIMRNRAAIAIQCFWRIILSQRISSHLKKIKIIEKIQSILKSFHILNEFKKFKIGRSCFQIQSIIRSHVCFTLIEKKKFALKSTIFIQRYFKKRFFLKSRSSIIIQKHWKGFLARKLFEKEKRFQMSIVKIQTFSRKFLAVMIVKRKIREKSRNIIARYEKLRLILKSLSFVKETTAAIIIQKNWRRHLAIFILKKKKQDKLQFVKAICHVQKMLKGVKERKKFRSQIEKKACVYIQKVIRGYRARNYFKVLKKVHRSALLIQKNFRGYRCRRKFAMMKRIIRQEAIRKENLIKIKKEKEQRAIKASERLFKGRGLPDIPTTITFNIERHITEFKSDKIERIKSIYILKEENENSFHNKFEKITLIKDALDEFRTTKRDKSKSRKNKKKLKASFTQYNNQ